MNTLGQIIQSLPLSLRDTLSKKDLELPITGITSDSRAVKPGYIFVAVHGSVNDGHQFIPSVQEKGAALIVGEKPLPGKTLAPYAQVQDSRQALAQLAASYYGFPSHSMLAVGVTGTSGKTTTTYLLESILKASGFRVGVIGTVNFRFGSKVYPSTHTTPGPVELQGLLSEMKADGCTAVVMEVSSHALKQKRTAFMAFDGAVFTNLTSEHLDFHPDMEDYFRSKAFLFTEYARYAKTVGKNPYLVANSEDSYGKRLIKEAGAHPFIASDGDLKVDLTGIRGQLDGIEIRSGLTGAFNVDNIRGAVSVAKGMGLSSKAIEVGIASLKAVPGRLERVENRRGIHVWVDYAHKPDALEKVLQTLRGIRNDHRLITVFGCGGDRDRKKRPVMGRHAVELSDHVWITSDNPRTEDPNAIINEIVQGTQGHSNFQVEPDRRKAIFGAIQMAQPGDLVLIAGKGHEDYQILGTQKIHFDDREVASEALKLS